MIDLAAYPRMRVGTVKKRIRKSAVTKKVKLAPAINSPKDFARKYLVSMIANYTKIEKTNPEIATERLNQLKQELLQLETGEMSLARYKILISWAKELKQQQAKRIEVKKLQRAIKNSAKVI